MRKFIFNIYNPHGQNGYRCRYLSTVWVHPRLFARLCGVPFPGAFESVEYWSSGGRNEGSHEEKFLSAHACSVITVSQIFFPLLSEHGFFVFPPSFFDSPANRSRADLWAGYGVILCGGRRGEGAVVLQVSTRQIGSKMIFIPHPTVK